MTKVPMIDAPDGGRRVKEWIGNHPDSMPPQSIRARIFQRHRGKCCLTGRDIRPGDAWDLHHVVGLLEGGTNRESNLAPALRDPHKAETARQRKRKAKIDAQRIIHIGAKEPSPFQLQGRPFPKVQRDRVKIDKSVLPPLPRRVCGVLVE